MAKKDSNSIVDWELYGKLKGKPIKYSNKIEKYIPKNESDDLNPRYLFQLIATDLLVAIVNEQIDPIDLAKKELENRGLDSNGKWVGFNH